MLYRDRFGVDLPAINGNASWTLPIPARLVIGADGRVAYAEADPDYTRRPEPEQMLAVFERIAGRRGAVAA